MFNKTTIDAPYIASPGIGTVPADPRKAQLLAAFEQLDDYGKRVLMAQVGALLTLKRSEK